MRLFTRIIQQGQGLAPVLLRRAARVRLSWDIRQKSRFQVNDTAGQPVAVSVPRGQVLRGGDVLVGDSQEFLVVESALQPLLKVTRCPTHGQPLDLIRAAYHLGNRHVTLALSPDALWLEHDPVLAEMLVRMHLVVTPVEAAFEPEGGAYAEHAHGHGHAHDHAHDHSHDHSHHGHHH